MGEETGTRWMVVDDLDRVIGETFDAFDAAREAAGTHAETTRPAAVLSVTRDDDGEGTQAVVWTSPDGYGDGSLSWPPQRDTFHAEAMAAGMLWHPVHGYYEPDDVLEEHARGEHDAYPDPDACSECERGPAL